MKGRDIMIDRLYEEFVEKAIPPETPITYNDTCVGHTIGNNFIGRPVYESSGAA